MKAGKTLTELATELERQQTAKKDYIADSRKVAMTDDAKGLTLAGIGQVSMTDHAKRQLAARLQIPVTFYDRMAEKHPDVLAHTVNELFQREPAKAMIRTLDNKARGIMSSSFRPLDNYDLADATIPELIRVGAKVESCEVTETRMYIKATLPQLDRELPMPAGHTMGKGHTIFARALRGAVVISNSDVGAGRLMISPAMLEKQCTNLATFKDDGFAAVHLGKSKGEDDTVREYLTDQTKRLEDAAIWAKTRDMIKAICDGRVMDKLVAQMLAAREDQITGNPIEVAEVFAKKNTFTEQEKGGLMRYLAESGEMTRYGLQWAVTRLAQDVESYDRSSDLERLGGSIIELPQSEWKVLAKAA